jgi:hypothetical protein
MKMLATYLCRHVTVNLEEVTEGFFGDKVGVPLVQGDIVRITLLSHLGQAEIAIEGKEQCVFMSVNESGSERFTPTTK